MSNRFDEIYARNEWGYGSGEGSLPVHTRPYVAYLQSFLKQNDIKSVVDMGCGDWQFSRTIDWNGIQYDGFDVAQAVVTRNQQNFSKPNIRFHCYSGNPQELPAADLLIAKDVLQHLPDEHVLRFLPHLSRYKMALLTNCVNPRGPTVHRDIVIGDFRFMDLRLPPYNLAAKEVLTFSRTVNVFRPKDVARWLLRGPEWKKVVLLVDNRSR